MDSGAPEILIIKPKPKHPGEMPPFVLPRGSRQYWEWNGDGRIYADVRDDETARAHADQLEPLTRTLSREIHEEAGIVPDDLARLEVAELGALPFASRSKGVYPIHWFIVRPDAACMAAMAVALPVDAMEVRWATVAHIRELMAEGNFSAGYLPVIERALGGKPLPMGGEVVLTPHQPISAAKGCDPRR